jgi:hypothetical protein
MKNRNHTGIGSLSPFMEGAMMGGQAVMKFQQGGKVPPMTLQDKARLRIIMSELAMDGIMPDKAPDGQPDVRWDETTGSWNVFVQGKPWQSQTKQTTWIKSGQKPQNKAAGGAIDPVAVQQGLRGRGVIPPRDYMPGFNPEFSYFQHGGKPGTSPTSRTYWQSPAASAL